MGTSDSLLHQIQEKIKWADTMSDVNKKHQKEFEDRVEEAKKSIKVSYIKLKHVLGINLHLLVMSYVVFSSFSYFGLTASCLDI